MDNNMAMTPKRVKMLIAGLVVMIAGFVLLAGGASSDPQVFDWSIFDFRRLVAAPVVILSGVVVMIISIIAKEKN